MADEKDDRLKQLIARRDALTAQIKRQEEKRKKTAKDIQTRRYVLTGVAMTEWAKRNNENEAILKAELDRFLTRDDERALFNLPEKKQ